MVPGHSYPHRTLECLTSGCPFLGVRFRRPQVDLEPMVRMAAVVVPQQEAAIQQRPRPVKAVRAHRTR
jgi:hypothetical protein